MNPRLVFILFSVIIFRLSAYNQVNYSWSTFTFENSDLPDDLVTSLSKINDTIWIGTASGLASIVDTVITDHSSLLPYYITCLGSDQSGNLWIGTANNGVFRRSGAGSFTNYTTASTLGGLTSNNIMSLECDGDSTWVGTDGDGLFLFHSNNWFNYRSSNHPFGWLIDQVLTIRTDDQHRVWFGTAQNGLVRKSTTGTYWKFTADSGLQHNFVRSIEFQGDSLLWIGQGNVSGDYGLSLLNLQTSALMNFFAGNSNGYEHQNVWDILIDSQNRKWIAENQQSHGLLLFNDTMFVDFEEFNSGLLSNRVYALQEDDSSRIWAGTFRGLSVNRQISTIGIPPVELLTFKAYPNPVMNELTIEFQTICDHADIKVWDLNGRVLMQTGGAVPTITVKLDLGHLPAGIYVVSVSNQSTHRTFKLVKL